MLPEIGHFALILSLFFALALSFVPILGYIKKHKVLMAYSTPLTHVTSLLVLFSFIILSYSFAVDDFSVLYVSQHSNSLLPFVFKLSAVWGGHDGSVLLWVLVLCGW